MTPVQLVRPVDNYARLETVEEGLQFLRGIPGPVAVISAVGAIHTGKSFLLNQLCETTTGFSVGYTVRPETHGIWTMKHPRSMPSTFGDHQKSWKGPAAVPLETTVLFLDTEGLFSKDASSSYDARLFAITTLLSSEVMYNTVKFIDTHHMDALETLIRRTNLFGLRAYAARASGVSDSVANLSEFLRLLVPTHLSWVVQDFVQDLEDREPEDWLQQLLSQDRNTSVSPTQEPKVLVNNFFKSIDCVTLPIPAATNAILQKLDIVNTEELDPDYMFKISRFRSRLLKRAADSPKLKETMKGVSGSVGGIPMSGSDLADLLIFLVEASNSASSSDTAEDQSPFPELPSVAEQFTKLQLRLMKSDILTILERDLRQVSSRRIQQNSPLSSFSFEQELQIQAVQAAKLWNATITGVVQHKSLSSPVYEAERDFLESLEEAKEQLRQVNTVMVREWCAVFIDGLLKDLREIVQAQVSGDPKPTGELQAIIANAESTVRARHRTVFVKGIPEACDTKEDHFAKLLSGVKHQLEKENEVLLKREIDEAGTKVMVNFNKCARENMPLLQEIQLTDLRNKLAECRREAIILLDTHVSRYPGVSVIAMRRSEAANAIDLERDSIFKKWADACGEKANTFISRMQRNLQLDVRRRVPFPVDEESLRDAIKEQSDDWRKRYKREVICSETEYGDKHDAEVEAVIETARTSLENANVNALKEIHSHAFKDMQVKLESTLDNYFWWPTLRAEAERSALTTLRSAWQEFRTDAPDNSEELGGRRREFSDALLMRTAQNFLAQEMAHARARLNMTVLLRSIIFGFDFGCVCGMLKKLSFHALYLLPVTVLTGILASSKQLNTFTESLPASLGFASAWAALATGCICGAVLGLLTYWFVVRESEKTMPVHDDCCGDPRISRGYYEPVNPTPMRRYTCHAGGPM